MSFFEDRLERFLLRELRVVNVHLPVKRKSLKELLSEDKPYVICRNGSIHRFKRDELRLLESILPKEFHERLLLPILIEVIPLSHEIMGIVRGEIEVYVISKVLGIETRDRESITLYKPHIMSLRRKLPTTTQYVFSQEYLSLYKQQEESFGEHFEI